MNAFPDGLPKVFNLSDYRGIPDALPDWQPPEAPSFANAQENYAPLVTEATLFNYSRSHRIHSARPPQDGSKPAGGQ